MARFVTLDFDTRKELGVSMMEYALAERIYFLAFNKGNQFPGWCYASKQTLADELGYSRSGILKAINTLEDKNYIHKNAQGWISPTQKYHDIVHKVSNKHGVQGVHLVDTTVHLVNTDSTLSEQVGSTLSVHNNKNIDIEINKDLKVNTETEVSATPQQTNSQELVETKKPNLPEKVETWNGLKIGTKVKDRDHRIMPWEEYVKIQQSHNRRSCAPINAPLVWLSSDEYNKLKTKYKSEEMVRAMIVVMNNWKAKTKFAEQRNINDYLAIDDSWVAEKAVKELAILNGQTIEKLRKQEVMKEEFKKNNAVSFYTPEPYKPDEA